LEVKSSDSGLHIVCEAKTKKDKSAIMKDAQSLRILINIIRIKNNKLMFSLNYSGVDLNKITEFTKLLEKVLFE
jgi:DNA-binding transcriptional MocR family regulator